MDQSTEQSQSSIIQAFSLKRHQHMYFSLRCNNFIFTHLTSGMCMSTHSLKQCILCCLIVHICVCISLHCCKIRRGKDWTNPCILRNRFILILHINLLIFMQIASQQSQQKTFAQGHNAIYLENGFLNIIKKN